MTFPAGAMATALNRFAEQSGVQLLHDAGLAQKRQSPGLHGSFSTAEGLTRLLAGSGLTFRQTAPFTGVIDTAAAVEDGGAIAPTGKVIVNGTTACLIICAAKHPTPNSYPYLVPVIQTSASTPGKISANNNGGKPWTVRRRAA